LSAEQAPFLRLANPFNGPVDVAEIYEHLDILYQQGLHNCIQITSVVLYALQNFGLFHLHDHGISTRPQHR